MKNAKIYILMIGLTVLLAGCGFDLVKSEKTLETKKESVNFEKNSDKKILTQTDTADWLNYESGAGDIKFLYPENLTFYNFADVNGGAILFYDSHDYKEKKCDLIKEYHYSCPDLPMIMSFGMSGFLDDQEVIEFQKENEELYSKAEKIKINQKDAYLIYGSYSELNSGHNNYISENLIRIYIPDYRGNGSLSLLTFTMALNKQYTKDVFMRIIDSLSF